MQPTEQPTDSIQPISRALVLQLLREETDDADSPDWLTELSGNPDADAYKDTGRLVDFHINFTGVREWLSDECEDYHSYIASTAELDAEDDYEQYQVFYLNSALDTSILDRIRAGNGPCSAQYTDLLAPLRLSENATPWRTEPVEETYVQMRDVLMAWNEHATSDTVDDQETRYGLICAMYARMSALNTSIDRRRSADALEDSSRKLLHAVHNQWHDTAGFHTKDSSDLLIIILAHIGFADIEVDEDLKYLMFRTLISEREYIASIAHKHQRREVIVDIAAAKLQGHKAMVHVLETRRLEWESRLMRQNAEILLRSIQSTRKRIYHHALGQLLILTIFQAAQKSVLHKKIVYNRNLPFTYSIAGDSSRWSTHLPLTCSQASTHLQHVLTTHHSTLENQVSSLTHLLSTTSTINKNRVLTRALKFVGRDLKDVTHGERERIVKLRMKMPATAVMMSDAVAGMRETKGFVEEMSAEVDAIGEGLEVVRRAGEREGREYEGFLKIVEGGLDGDGSGMV